MACVRSIELSPAEVEFYRMSTIDSILAVWFFIVGACVGSFLNVVVYRLPRRESLIRPASRCPQCNHPIRPWDNIPIASWIFLRGRCRDCGSNISGQYPLTEALIGIWFLSCSLVTMNAVPTRSISPWILSIFLAVLGSMIFAAAKIIQAGANVPRALRWALFITSAGTLFALLSVVSN